MPLLGISLNVNADASDVLSSGWSVRPAYPRFIPADPTQGSPCLVQDYAGAVSLVQESG